MSKGAWVDFTTTQRSICLMIHDVFDTKRRDLAFKAVTSRLVRRHPGFAVHSAGPAEILIRFEACARATPKQLERMLDDCANDLRTTAIKALRDAGCELAAVD